ncbi:MAG: YceI family protein [Verrucomicrobia bacterium]|nr:YceI family protein [Verrucomicrobiota bacterium]
MVPDLIKAPGVVPIFFLLGCGNPADHVPAASVNKPSGAAMEGEKAAATAGQFFAFKPEPSTIGFVGSKVTGSHNGGFKSFAGEFRVVNGRVADTGNKVVIDTTSLWADDNRLTSHLKSADFFDVAQHPTATFVTTSVSQAKDGATVTGDLNLHGITQSISFPAKIGVSESAVSVTAEFAINRFDFEIKYPGRANDLIRKEVVLKLNVQATSGRADLKSIEQAAQTSSATAASPAKPGGPRRPKPGQ